MPGVPIPPSCLMRLLFVHCFNFSFTFNCLILLIFISLISWRWTDPIGWCSFFHSRPQNRLLVIQLIGCLSVKISTPDSVSYDRVAEILWCSPWPAMAFSRAGMKKQFRGAYGLAFPYHCLVWYKKTNTWPMWLLVNITLKSNPWPLILYWILSQTLWTAVAPRCVSLE